MNLPHLVAGERLETPGEPPPALLERALGAASAALEPLAVASVALRAAALEALADALDAQTPMLARLAADEVGCPITQAPALHVGSAVGVLRAFANLARTHVFDEQRTAARGGRAQVLKHPVGVALGVVPWNVPLYLACAKLGAALAAGTPMILKPSPENAGTLARFADALAALPLPPGAVQMLTAGRETGATLVADPRVAKISFTGSTAAGRAVAAAAAERFARLTLELGGKSAAILLDDVDPGAIRPELFLAMLQNNGQVCGAQSRVLVPAARAAELTSWLAALFDGLAVGDPHDPTTEVGPLATAAQAARFRSMTAASAATPLSRDHAPAGDRFVTPRLYAAEGHDPLWRDEIFGPIVCVQSYATEAEAIALANASPYGLSGSVWSAEPARAATVAAGLRTGTVGINSKRILDFNAPFGGWRASGLGRELGPEGIDAYLETTTILLP